MIKTMMMMMMMIRTQLMIMNWYGFRLRGLQKYFHSFFMGHFADACSEYIYLWAVDLTLRLPD